MSDRVADIVIVAKSATTALREMTERCLASLRASEPELLFEVIIVETQPGAAAYAGGQSVRPEPEPLNYNRYLNAGLAACRTDVVVFCNNDLIFHPGWLRAHLQAFAANPQLGCLSSRDPAYTALGTAAGLCEGYLVNRELFQWCIAFRRSALQQLGPLDEHFAFYGADDALCWQLQRQGIRHALNRSSLVTHLARQTHGTLPPDVLAAMTTQQGHSIVRAAAAQERVVGQLGTVMPGSAFGVAGVP